MPLQGYSGEPDIQRLFDAFKRERVDRVPNFEVLIEDQHVEKLLGRSAGNTLSYGGDPAKGVEESEGARPMHPEDYIELCRLIGQDAIIVEAIWTPFRKRNSDGSAGGLIADRSIKTREDFRNNVVLPGSADIAAKMGYVREYREAIDRSGSRIGFCVLMAAFFQTLYEFVIGLEDTMSMVSQDRGFLEELLEVSTEYWVDFCRAAVENGVDFIWTADDVAFRTGMFLPPQTMKEIWAPRLRRIHEPAVEAGKPVMFHSDGNIVDLIPMLLDSGVDCIHPMDPYGVDYREMKRRFGGAVCLAGNIDIEHPLAHGTPAEVDEDVRRHMEALKPGGGYVCSSSHSIVNYIPHENFVSMINAIHAYGRYDQRTWRGVEKGSSAAEDSAKPRQTSEEELLAGIDSEHQRTLFHRVFRGDPSNVRAAVEAALSAGSDALELVTQVLTPAIRAVGERFSTGEMFLPELMLSSAAMQDAMKYVSPLLEGGSGVASRGRIVIGTIAGDLHDIGKNIVRTFLQANGFEVIDIGVDNEPQTFVDAIIRHQPDVVGYSGLLTTTLAGVPEQMEALQRAGLRGRVITIVGGAPVTADFAIRNGVDLYAPDANEAVLVIEKALQDAEGR